MAPPTDGYLRGAGVKDIVVFGGTAHPELTAEICGHLGVTVAPVVVSRFANDCLEVQLQANCRERDVFLVQPLVTPVQENLVELLLMCDAARGASAARITVVMPHYAYARSDKKDAPRISIGGRLVADLLQTAGAGRVLAVTLHSPQVHGFFSVPVDHLHALRELAAPLPPVRPVPDHRGVARPRQRQGGGRLRPDARGAAWPPVPSSASRTTGCVISDVIGDVADRDLIVLDDEIAKGSTVLELLRLLRDPMPGPSGSPARTGCSPTDSLKRLSEQEDVLEIVCTNTVPDPGRAGRPRSSGCCRSPRAGRGDPAHPQRGVGQRAVRRLSQSGPPPSHARALSRDPTGTARIPPPTALNPRSMAAFIPPTPRTAHRVTRGAHTSRLCFLMASSHSLVIVAPDTSTSSAKGSVTARLAATASSRTPSIVRPSRPL